jgi:hypothetical protein
MIAAYVITAVILVGYAVRLLIRVRRMEIGNRE